MLTVWIIMAYVFYLWVNVGVAIVNRDIRADHLRKGNHAQINHPLWGLIYIALMLPGWFVLHSWWFIAAITLQHLWFFPAVFNMLIGMPLFNLSKTSSAWTDKTLVSLGFKSTEKIVLIAFVVSVLLLIKSIING